MTAKRASQGDLRALARAWGIRLSFTDAAGGRRTASSDQLLAALRSLGAPVHGMADVASALDERRTAQDIAPVHVAWEGRLPPLQATFEHGSRVRARLTTEEGDTREWIMTPRRVRGGSGWGIGLRDTLPLGHHRLELQAGARIMLTHVVAAPELAYLPDVRRWWGVFLPLYAARTSGDLGIGDLGDLETIARWAGSLGARLAGTLPLLPVLLAEPFEPSPYAPVSRLFWGDHFLDVARLPAVGAATITAPAARGSAYNTGLVDYRKTAALKRTIVNEAAQRFFDSGSDRNQRFREFLQENPHARDYARFRAAGDRRAESWLAWPERMRGGRLHPSDYDAADERYHLYAAWTAQEQLARVVAAPGAASLYLDLPLGVSRDGYDPWKFRDLFALDASAGAPPDPFFPHGQDWGFAPLHPDAVRRDGHRYFAACLRHHFRFAGALRLDHVMSLQRLYWIPAGLAPDRGVYIQYPLEEMFAVLTLESVRHRCMVIGEDLGTVSREIRSAMRRHAVQRMFVVQYEALPDRKPPLPDVPQAVVASLNTHDMPTFAAYWDALDLADREELGLLETDEVVRESEARARLRKRLARQLRMLSPNGAAPSSEQALATLLQYLAGSRARIVLINLEDLWLEPLPQNVPGTSTERPNWRRRARHTLDEIVADNRVTATLRRIAQLRDQPNES